MPSADYDALDRVGQVSDSLLGDTETFTYNSLDSIQKSTESYNNSSVTYTYDKNGRRTTMSPSWETVVFNYGYDCDDRLIGMSNNGSSIPSCNPTTNVTNGTLSPTPTAQFTFIYTGLDRLLQTLSDDVLTSDTLIDNDERTTERDYYSYPNNVHYGNGTNLTYTYDLDGRVIDKGGNFAAVNLPPTASATYGYTDQVA
jgi:hypothetical protein